MKTYKETHQWITFKADLRKLPHDVWITIGECQSKCEHLAGVPLRPENAKEFYLLYLAKGVQGTTAIEGNTLSEEDVRAHISGELRVPPSRKYLQQEVDNIVTACNEIAAELSQGRAGPISSERIKNFNRRVLQGLELENGVVPGAIPTHMVGVGRYRGCPREDCEYLLDRLSQWLQSGDFQPTGSLGIGMALIKAVLAHLYIAWIHPFGDGNGRTARLLEFQILLASGVPAPAAHLLSNFYNQTRSEYYRQLDYASKSGGDVTRFIQYAVQGFRDGIREQIIRARQQQWDVMWTNHVYDTFRARNTEAGHRRRNLVLDISKSSQPVTPAGVRELSPRLAGQYAVKTDKTIQRDINVLLKLGLIRKQDKGYYANKDIILAFLPPNLATPQSRGIAPEERPR